MTPDQQAQLDEAHDCELEAATCLALGMARAAEIALAYADEIHARIDRDQRRAA